MTPPRSNQPSPPECGKFHRTNDLVPLAKSKEKRGWGIGLQIMRDLRDIPTECNVWIWFGSGFE